MSPTETVWLIIGFGGQGLFFTRWLVQWFRSEREQESMVPISFWYLSLVGGLITLAYAIYRKDPVFIVGQAVGSVVYFRNLMLIHRNRPVLDVTTASPPPISTGGGPPPVAFDGATGTHAPSVPTPKN